MAFLYVAAYAVPAAAIWVLVGALLRPLGERPWALASVAVIFTLRYGLAETLNLPLQSPGHRWQVPARWIRGRTRTKGVLTWGALLGPGLIARNPYAGMWLLPFVVSLDQSLLTAGLVGGTHGTARALGVLHNLRLDCNVADMTAWNAQWRWRLLDGVLLLVSAGALVGQGMWALATS
ncbi:MAG: hypothetical protein ACRDJW_09875 [Thermomicrobiales bacterium]